MTVGIRGRGPARRREPRFPARSRAESLFGPVRDRYGWRLALVFGNHARGGFCPYYTHNRCFHCDIGAGEGAAFDLTTNRRRLAWFRDYYRPQLSSINHLVVYNSGSVLNPREMPPELLEEIVAFARALPAVRVISLDSRESFIRPGTVRQISSSRATGITIRPILGIESADDRIRNEVLRKGMPRTAIDRVFKDLGQLAAEFGQARIGLDVNIVIAGPGTTPLTAVDDAVMTARQALLAGIEHGVPVDLNLHPYYVGARGSDRFPDHRRCPLLTIVRTVTTIAELVRSMESLSSLYIGWNDEGHDLEQEERQLEIEHARAAFDRFNQTNDPGALFCLERCESARAEIEAARRGRAKGVHDCRAVRVGYLLLMTNTPSQFVGGLSWCSSMNLRRISLGPSRRRGSISSRVVDQSPFLKASSAVS